MKDVPNEMIPKFIGVYNKPPLNYDRELEWVIPARDILI